MLKIYESLNSDVKNDFSQCQIFGYTIQIDFKISKKYFDFFESTGQKEGINSIMKL